MRCFQSLDVFAKMNTCVNRNCKKNIFNKINILLKKFPKFSLDFILVSIVRLCLKNYMRVKASYQLFEFSYFPLFKKNLGNCWPMGGSRLESPLSSTIKKQSIHSRQRISRTPSFGYYTPSGARGCYLVHLLQFSFLVRIIASRFALLGIRFFASFPIVRNQTMNYLCANENYSPPESSGSMRNYFP